MLGLTTLGIVQTAISLVALASGAVALLRDREIRPGSTLGKAYLLSTILTRPPGPAVAGDAEAGRLRASDSLAPTPVVI